jgi:hypothetical protein
MKCEALSGMPSIGTKAQRTHRTSTTKASAKDNGPHSDKAASRDIQSMAQTLLDQRVLIIANSCHREAARLANDLQRDPRLPKFQQISACSPDLFPMMTRTRRPAIIEMFQTHSKPPRRPSLLLTDLDVLTTTQTKQLCHELRAARKPNDGCILAVWPGIPKKSITLLPENIVVETHQQDDASASRVAARSILTDYPPPTMQDHGELVPACERSLVGLLVHANMYHMAGPGATPQYLKALECTLMADPADRLSQSNNFTPTVELASIVRTIGVGQVLSERRMGTLPSGELPFTKLLAAHATSRTRLKAVRELCTNHHLTMRELAMAIDKDIVDVATTGAARRAKTVLA